MLAYRMVDVFLLKEGSMNNLFHIMALVRDRPLFKLVVVAMLLGYSFAEGNCGSHLKSSAGTIQSPNYPNPYSAGQECTWTVSVGGPVENIRISFSAFNLQRRNNAGDCVDYVAIYRLLLNKDAEAVMEGKFCGNSIPSSISIGKSSMTVQFVSDSGPDSLSYTGFSLNYKAYFEDTAEVSQSTAGIIGAIFCAVAFIGLCMLCCVMNSTCTCSNVCDAQNAPNTRNRQVVSSSSSTYQAGFPPSYRRVMHHPERFPTPESTPRILLQRNGTVRVESLTPSEPSDDEDTPPPHYPGNVSGEDLVAVDITSNDINNETDMDHPERFPAPESSPQILLQRNGTVTEGSLTPNQDRLERMGTLQSSNSETSDDEDTPPPPSPGDVSSEDLVAVDIASNDTNERDGLSNTGSHNIGVITDERESHVTEGFPEVSSREVIVSVEVEPRLSAASAHKALSDMSTVERSSGVVRDNLSPSKEAVELTQTGVVHDDDREVEIFI